MNQSQRQSLQSLRNICLRTMLWPLNFLLSWTSGPDITILYHIVRRYIIELKEPTEMRLSSESISFPEQKFYLVDFLDLKKKLDVTTYLSDVIGILNKFGNADTPEVTKLEKSLQGTPTRKRIIMPAIEPKTILYVKQL